MIAGGWFLGAFKINHQVLITIASITDRFNVIL